MTSPDRSLARWIFRATMWPWWAWGTWLAAHGHDALEGHTDADFSLALTVFLPILPLAAIFLFLDLVQLRRARVARRRLGSENYERFLKETHRLPEIPALWSWPVRLLLAAAPFALFWIMEMGEFSNYHTETAWTLAIGYAGLFGLVLLLADVSVGSRYRRGGAWTR